MTTGRNLDDDLAQRAVFDLASIYADRGECEKAAAMMARIRAAGIAGCPEQRTDE